jgi:hypothetical protein
MGEEYPRVFGVDPGLATGYCFFNQGALSYSKTVSGLDEQYDYLSGLNIENSLVVMEEFAIYPWAAKDLSFDKVPSARIIGAVELSARVWGETTVVYQNPQQAKESVPNKLIHELFPDHKAGSPHEMDAIRHVVLRATLNLSTIDKGDRGRVY